MPQPTFTSFNVGPSQLWPGIETFLADAYSSGLLSRSHRSQQFMTLYDETAGLLRDRHQLPADYQVYLLSSATECWQVLADSLTPRRSLHLYSGDFGQRWFEIARQLRPESLGIRFGLDDAPAVAAVPPDWPQYDLLALTHNETSNTTTLPPALLSSLRAAQPHALLAVDATSSMGGVVLPYAQADIWFASVQKCFGLPAGLALMFASPKAVERLQALGDSGSYNSLHRIHQKAQLHQTTHTPNMLGLYLLRRVMEATPALTELDATTRQRAAMWYQFVAKQPSLQPLVSSPAVRSFTTIGISYPADKVAGLRKAAEAEGYLLGGGYGPWKLSSFRVANFPAIPQEALSGLQAWLAANL